MTTALASTVDNDVTTVANDNRSNETLDVDAYLQSHLGRRYRDLGECIVLLTVYSVIFVTGVVGNVSTCLVIIRNKRMHTATNYYLFSLAISDLLTLVLGLPPELYTILEAYPWRFGAPYCLFKTFLTEMTSSASILTIAAFTIERYLAICHSLRAQATSGLSRAVRCIVLVWVAACLTALPYPIHTRTYYYMEHPWTAEPLEDSLICTIPGHWMTNMRYAFQVSTFLLFVLPMVLITVLYVRIGIALRRSTMSSYTPQQQQQQRPQLQRRGAGIGVLGRASAHHSATNGNGAAGRLTAARVTTNRVAQSRKSIFKMLVAVVVAFFICWAPFHAQRLMTVYIRDDQWTPTWLELQSHLFYISGVLYFVSTTVNPILYNVMSRKYRQAFKMTLCYSCMDDESRQRLHRDGFGASTVYYSAAAYDNSAAAGGVAGDSTTKNRRTWRNSNSSTAAEMNSYRRGGGGARQPFSNESSSSQPEPKTPPPQDDVGELQGLTAQRCFSCNGARSNSQLRAAGSHGDGSKRRRSRSPDGVALGRDGETTAAEHLAGRDTSLQGRRLQVPGRDGTVTVGLLYADYSTSSSQAGSLGSSLLEPLGHSNDEGQSLPR